MTEIDPDTLIQQVVLLGLATKQEALEAKAEADDGSTDAISRVLLRRGILTRWQLDRLSKGEASGFFIGGCKILFHIAEGSFARVYRGEKMPGGQTVAIKIMRQRFASDPEAVARFNQEAEAGMRLIHPNIVRTYEYGEDDGRYYMTMEFVEGSNLRDFLRVRGRVAESEALPLLLGLSRALAYSLEHGVTHRDIKGTNILIASNGTAKLVDFGLATVEGDGKGGHGQNQRTVDYSALERTCNSPKGDPRSDIFFLGCVFYQMLTGHLPLPEVETSDPLAKMLKRGINSIKPLHELREAPSAELCSIIERMMKVDLRARYQSMSDVVRDLEAFSDRLAGKSEFDDLFLSRDGASSEASLDDEDWSDAVHEPSGEIRIDRTRKVLCVEVQDEIQQAFRKTLSAMGYRVLIVGDAERAVERFREESVDAVIFDTDGLGSGAVDAFLEMHSHSADRGRRLDAVVLFAAKRQALAERLPNDDRLIVLHKPVKMKQVQDAIARLLPIED
ncbi:MAG: protein kinase [Isosphaeraceae bacterium]|nr:protein kinase [Isosphaeraceae bacterium]